MCSKAICYYRVSTNKQGVSGLGLEAQQEIALAYCKQNNLEVIGEFEEVQSGGKNDREMIKTALEKCRITHARLVVAKLDRISRDVGFIDQLQKSGIKFVCADMPEANDTMIQFMSVFAQYERRMASERTKAALAAKKARGESLGNPNIKQVQKQIPSEASEKGNAVKIAKADEWASLVIGHIDKAKDNGCQSLQQIADWLNAEHITTSRGNQFTSTSVKRIIDRHQNLS